MTEYINYGETTVPLITSKVEQMKNAKYICDFALKTKLGGWSENPAQIYWQEKPPVEGYSHYFGMIIQMGSVYIVSGAAMEDVEVNAIRSGDEILFSRYRHDFRQSIDGNCAIDGGRDYTKISGNPEEHLVLKLQGPELVIVRREPSLHG